MLDFWGLALAAYQQPSQTAMVVAVILGLVLFAQLGLALMRHAMRMPYSIIDAVSLVIVFLAGGGMVVAVIGVLAFVANIALQGGSSLATTGTVVFLTCTVATNAICGFLQFHRHPLRMGVRTT